MFEAQVTAPTIPLRDGENYRFHFDATQCVGCKCCEVACHEQNNNPADVKWRTVGEVEGGEFPETKRFYMSMSCNHCLDPACLKGCPVDAYEKNATTGVVTMKEDVCIGCQYCTWNCPYGAPQFNAERGMVTKCDMCHHRLAEGNQPACVDACPSGALAIETFMVDAWKKNPEQGNAPGVPDAAITGSTTRITPPKKNGFDLKRIDEYRIKPEHPHASLIFLTVFTQLSVGGFVCLFALELIHHYFQRAYFPTQFLEIGHLAMLGTAMLALNASLFHLGRPIYAIRALKMWRRSWLSREALFFTLFIGAATLYSLMRWQKILAFVPNFQFLLGAVAALFGMMGVFCQAMIYRVPARPSWDTWRTPLGFLATAFILGPLLSLTLLTWSVRNVVWMDATAAMSTVGIFLALVMVLAGFVQIAGIVIKVLNALNKEEPELKASARLLTQRFQLLFLLRLGILLLSILGVPFLLLEFGAHQTLATIQLTILLTMVTIAALLSEIIGRYLFFVTVVPKKRPEGYF